jgi:hypothetical protein
MIAEKSNRRATVSLLADDHEENRILAGCDALAESYLSNQISSSGDSFL